MNAREPNFTESRSARLRRMLASSELEEHLGARLSSELPRRHVNKNGVDILVRAHPPAEFWLLLQDFL